jgi:adenylate kinase family enzyme
MTDPMSDDALIALAQRRFDQAECEGAGPDDCRQLRDIFPAVLQRLREKVEITRDLVMIEEIDLSDRAAMARLSADNQQQRDDDQLQLSLQHL